MAGYSTRTTTVSVGGADFHLRALSDRQQFADPHGLAKKAGISSAQWSLFGQLWPASRILAETMVDFDISGKRILEVGCGLGLASLVLHKREADITASDHHPLADTFLQHNAKLNHLPPLRYVDLPWNGPTVAIGQFDVIIGSDILYERDHAPQLAALLLRHAKPSAQILFTDPGRGNCGPFTRYLEAQGYAFVDGAGINDAGTDHAQRLRVLSYARN